MAACGLITACFAIAFFGKSALASRMDAWKLLPRPERITELYFAQHTRLPDTFLPNDQQTISFTVHNLEHQTTEYRYTVMARGDHKKQVLAEGRFALSHGTSQNITRRVVVPSLGARVAMQVSVEYSGIPFGQDKASLETQSIHYWINLAT